MSEAKTVNQKLLANPCDGKEIIDSLGRKIRLKKPNVCDEYELMKVLGEDSKNQMCLSYAIPLMYVASIDGEIMEEPRVYSAFKWLLNKVGSEGREAVLEFMNSVNETKESEIEKAKK